MTYAEFHETVIVRFQKTGGAREQTKIEVNFFFEILAVFFSETFHSGVFNYAHSDKIKFEKLESRKIEKMSFFNIFANFIK